MKKHLKKIQQRPLEERKKMATVFAVIFTILIVILWLLVSSFLPQKEYRSDITQEKMDELNEFFVEDTGEEYYLEQNEYEDFTEEVKQNQEESVFVEDNEEEVQNSPEPSVEEEIKEE